ncbi:exonuclease domain-containing protein [Actinosynnema sp. NPDC059335]|uniref:exonuclease domain-containing protein n=1 Tax=Actinosynnema sp. NPDC059335 TaxID=3346804 RepID=UPI00366E0132
MTWPDWHRKHVVCFDVETTGPDPETALIVTADFVQLDLDTGEIVSTRSYLADPGVEIPAEATAVHGITTEHAREHGQPADEVALLVLNDIEVAWGDALPLVGFNIAYDLTVVDRELRRHHEMEFKLAGPVLDPYVIDRGVDRYRKGKRKLTDLCALYGVSLENAHNSAADAEAAGRLLKALANKYQNKVGRRGLRDLWRSQCAWYRTWAEGLERYFRSQDTTPADREYWDAHEHRARCDALDDSRNVCACGPAPTASPERIAKVTVDPHWPLKPLPVATEAAAR